MTKYRERREVLILRKQGLSYNQIKNKIQISKSTLSRWLQNYPLSKKQINILRGSNKLRIEKFRNTLKKKHEERLHVYYDQEKKKIIPLLKKNLYIAGLFLYWGEGNKFSRYTVSINNTDPAILKFCLYWMVYSLHVDKKRIKVFLHLYEDMDTKKEMSYWSNILNISLVQFMKPYIKKSKKKDIDQKGFGHGTCGLRIDDVMLKERILMGLKAISDFSEI